ncbi:MAG: hypothetical protein LBQ28_09710 [Prevotellaceae bacterium]|jgi:uncharacterized lipoprotein YehR (DUF1307 family)|nr:hypothetical protein [Prevotellaceae bacterium]
MKKIYIIQILLLSIFLTGCSDSTEYKEFEDVLVKIDNSNVIFSAIGGTGDIIVAESVDFTAVSDKDWCQLTVSGQKITATVEPNMSISGRTARVTIKSGNRVNYVSVTQYGIRITRTVTASGKGEEIRISYNYDVPVIFKSVDENWVSCTVETDEIVLTVQANPSLTETRSANVVLQIGTVELFEETVTVNQEKNYLEYADYLGTYVMTYSNTYNSTTPSFSINVELVEKVAGESFYLKGILQPAYDDNFLIPIGYSGATGLSIVTQALGFDPVKDMDIWIAVTRSESNSYSIGSGYGLVSTGANLDSGHLAFSFTDNGKWTGYTTIGISFRYLVKGTSSTTGATTAPIGNGTGDKIRYYYMTFEKQ